MTNDASSNGAFSKGDAYKGSAKQFFPSPMPEYSLQLVSRVWKDPTDEFEGAGHIKNIDFFGWPITDQINLNEDLQKNEVLSDPVEESHVIDEDKEVANRQSRSETMLSDKVTISADKYEVNLMRRHESDMIQQPSVQNIRTEGRRGKTATHDIDTGTGLQKDLIEAIELIRPHSKKAHSYMRGHQRVSSFTIPKSASRCEISRDPIAPAMTLIEAAHKYAVLRELSLCQSRIELLHSVDRHCCCCANIHLQNVYSTATDGKVRILSRVAHKAREKQLKNEVTQMLTQLHDIQLLTQVCAPTTQPNKYLPTFTISNAQPLTTPQLEKRLDGEEFSLLGQMNDIQSCTQESAPRPDKSLTTTTMCGAQVSTISPLEEQRKRKSNFLTQPHGIQASTQGCALTVTPDKSFATYSILEAQQLTTPPKENQGGRENTHLLTQVLDNQFPMKLSASTVEPTEYSPSTTTCDQQHLTILPAKAIFRANDGVVLSCVEENSLTSTTLAKEPLVSGSFDPQPVKLQCQRRPDSARQLVRASPAAARPRICRSIVDENLQESLKQQQNRSKLETVQPTTHIESQTARKALVGSILHEIANLCETPAAPPDELFVKYPPELLKSLMDSNTYKTPARKKTRCSLFGCL